MMDKDRDHVAKRILKLTLEIIYLLTGEEYGPVKKMGEYTSLKSIMDLQFPSWALEEEQKDEKILDLTNKIIRLLTGKVPITYEDIMVSFTMEEWEYVEGHKDLYKDIIMQDPQSFSSPVDIVTTAETDSSVALKSVLPCTSIDYSDCPAIDDGSMNTSISDGYESPSYSLDCTEEDFEISQDGNEKYSNLQSNQEDDEDDKMENERDENDPVSQQDMEEDNYISDDSREDETVSHDWKLEADYISKDCKQEMEDLPKDCKQEMEDAVKDCKRENEDSPKDCKQETEDPPKDCKQESEDLPKDCKREIEDPPKDCKQEEAKKFKDCKYEDDVVERCYEDDLLKDVKIEVVSDNEWEEEMSFWGEQGRHIFDEEIPGDFSSDISNNRMTVERCPHAFYPHCKKGDGGVSQDYQPPIPPGEIASNSNPQAMPNCHVGNRTATLNNINAKNCVRTFPPTHQIERMPQVSLPATQDHAQMGQQQKNINTARKTTSDIQTLQNFMSEMNENRKVEEIPHTELDTLLSKFILLVKRKDGNEYEPHTLRCMVGSIDRFLKEHSYHHTIIYGNSKDFPLTKQSLNAKIKFLKKIAESNPPIRPEALTDDDIENLYKAGTLSLDNPTSLLNLVFFNNGIHFALRTKEQYSLQWGDIKLKIDPRGNQYLEYSDRQSEALENRKNIRQMKPRIYAMPHVPDRDPVTAYLKYQSFRPSAMMAPDSPFYLAPNVNYNPAFSEWYRSTKIGIQKIRAMMTTMKIRASLPESKRKVSYITKRRLVERLPQHTLAASGAMVPTAQQHHLQNFASKSTIMEMKQRKSGIIINNLHTTLARPSQERLPTTSSIQPHPSTSRYGELPIHKRSFLATDFAQQRNSNMFLNSYRYLTSEEPAKKHKPVYDFKTE
ncbi:uncharacterized protein LOC122940791 [Bufo gargarizans]|uniref:uncharacterized protein LOC122940791 n=1 Tax=Bufo gargarizans TaxID=30331 RepID=UPI001CF1BDF0|nr:uncharacterized protein LOC122940791 [Bufo gargarizans]